MSVPLSQQPPYQGYAYAYPHKTAYHQLQPALSIADVWRDEPRHALFLYLHIPFCEMRCGFCNLFTTVGSDLQAQTRYLDAVERQAAVVADQLGPVQFAQAAIGGGTPTLLPARLLDRAFTILETSFDTHLSSMPLSVETSPATALPDRLAVLRERGVRRVSMGVQSFVQAEVRASGRPQRTEDVVRALHAIRDCGFDVLNVDLIYGQPHQTPATWRYSLDRTLEWSPEEVFLYPMYVRPLTGLGRTQKSWDDERLALYRVGRDHLLSRGYRQFSMRLFRRDDLPRSTTRYRCQADGMVGLGAGSRSYTCKVHYACEWGVGRRRVQSILQSYVDRTDAEHALVDHGFLMSDDERQRRHLLQSLLCADGLDRGYYRSRFGADPLLEHPQLNVLIDEQLAIDDGRALRLTAAGVERSDAIAPWLTSSAVRRRMAGFDLR